MSQPTEERRGEVRSAADWADKLANSESSVEWRTVRRRRTHRRPANADRNSAIGSFLLGVTVLLIVIGGLGMIMKGCAEFGSPFLSEQQTLRQSSGSPVR